jgi:cell division protein FtsN
MSEDNMAERYGSKTDVAVKLILVFFISLLSFSIGTFVGKKFSDNQHKISQLENPDKQDKTEAGDNDRDVASVQASTEVKPSEALNDEEIKKLAEEFVSDDEGKKHEEAAGAPHENVGEKKEEGKTQTEAKPTEAAAAIKEVSKEVVTSAKKQVSEADKKPSEAATRAVAGETPEQAEVMKVTTPKNRVPQSLPKELASSAVGKFTVQVGSYPNKAEAEKTTASLKTKGFNAFYVDAKVKSQTWYRVNVGIFATEKEASTYKSDLLARSKVSSAIVQKITN